MLLCCLNTLINASSKNDGRSCKNIRQYLGVLSLGWKDYVHSAKADKGYTFSSPPSHPEPKIPKKVFTSGNYIFLRDSYFFQGFPKKTRESSMYSIPTEQKSIQNSGKNINKIDY